MIMPNMVRFTFLALVHLLVASLAAAALLVDYDAARGDDPSKLGTRNLEATRDVKPKENSDGLYIKADVDWRGTKCGHFHRNETSIRTEYHSLNGKTESGKTYFIGYQFALGATPHALMVWQWKEYEANGKDGNGANIPLSLEIRDGELQLGYSSKKDASRAPQWKTAIKPKTLYTVGIEILAKSSGGHVRLWWDGNPVIFSTTGTTTVQGNMFPGRSDPKFGAYRGEGVVVDSYVYQVQIGNSKGELDNKFF